MLHKKICWKDHKNKNGILKIIQLSHRKARQKKILKRKRNLKRNKIPNKMADLSCDITINT
jgi:hypothetical protein